MGLKHEEGFENEARFSMVSAQASNDCPTLMVRTVKRIIAHFAPEFTENLFAVRTCVRKLRYIGCHWCEDQHFYGDSPDSFFKIGNEYESIDFNGATYTINGYENGKQRIGAAFFERIT
ncbi:MAG: hypothetical protein A2X59_00070 [Nitrospirae bacterium GWC2_42_7]|nr:MAG: hypothetical protein A2X59_00070 [Nitrospirae bacterium GWC2_42_7]